MLMFMYTTQKPKQKGSENMKFYREKGKLMNVLSENSIDESLQNTLYALGVKGI